MGARLSSDDHAHIDAYVTARRSEGKFDTIDAFLVNLVWFLGKEKAAAYLGIDPRTGDPIARTGRH